MSEKLKIAKNGQWSLEKAIPSTKDVPDYYTPTKTNKIDLYSGKDADKAKKNILSSIVNLNSYGIKDNIKKMFNHDTGKEEPHILIHRGIRNTNNDASGPNKLKIDDNHIQHDTYAVHTLDPKTAKQYGDVYSFWVPLSNTVAMASYMAGRYKNPKQELPKGVIENARTQNQRENKFYTDNNLDLPMLPTSGKELENYARRFLQNDPHAEEESHILVAPGKYKRHL